MATKVRDRIIIQTEPVAVKIAEAAALIGVGETTLRKWIDKLGFPCVRAGGRIVIPMDKMRAWINESVGKTLEL